MTWLCWNKPTKRDEVTHTTNVYVAERFAPLVDQEILKEELEDYRHLEDIEIGMEEGGVHKYVNPYWGKILKI